MRSEALLFSAGVAFFVTIGAIYVVSDGEAAGIVLLFVAAIHAGLMSGWIWGRVRRNPAPRPEDRVDGDATDSVGVVGRYPSASLRPLAMAVGMSALALGVPVGLWLSAIGAALIASQVALMTRDADAT